MKRTKEPTEGGYDRLRSHVSFHHIALQEAQDALASSLDYGMTGLQDEQNEEVRSAWEQEF